MDEPEATFLLYTGRNIIGSNPFMANVYIPAKLHIDEIHAVIGNHDELQPLVFDQFFAVKCTYGSFTLDRNRHK